MEKIDWGKIKWPEEYPKRRLVVPDCMYELAREIYDDGVEVIKQSDTYLEQPVSAAE